MKFQPWRCTSYSHHCLSVRPLGIPYLSNRFNCQIFDNISTIKSGYIIVAKNSYRRISENVGTHSTVKSYSTTNSQMIKFERKVEKGKVVTPALAYHHGTPSPCHCLHYFIALMSLAVLVFSVVLRLHPIVLDMYGYDEPTSHLPSVSSFTKFIYPPLLFSGKLGK